jgi:hypothetical protein
MPVTPAHLGPVILVGALAGRKLNIMALITSAVLIDLEHIIFAVRYGDITNHGLWHTFGGAILYGIFYGILFFIMLHLFWKIQDFRYKGFEPYKKIRRTRKHVWSYSIKCILMSTILGAIIHISLDWVLYDNIRILAISQGNIYYDFTSQYLFITLIIVHLFCLITFLIGIVLYSFRYSTNKNKVYGTSSIYDLKIKLKDIWVMVGIALTPFAISGIMVYMIIISVYILNQSNRSVNLAEHFRLFILSFICIILMSLFYYKSLKNSKWKLFE